jgi:hypothetical protein
MTRPLAAVATEKIGIDQYIDIISAKNKYNFM